MKYLIKEFIIFFLIAFYVLFTALVALVILYPNHFYIDLKQLLNVGSAAIIYAFVWVVILYFKQIRSK
jgi:hypothetical protein